MTAREGMTNLISHLRGLTHAGTADMTLGAVTYWSDDQLQARLDQTRRTFHFEQLESLPVHNGGAYEVYDYQIPARMGRHFEQAGVDSGWAVKDSTGATIGTALYTFNAEARIISFGTVNQHGSVYYLDARGYDMNRAAAGVWREKAGYYASQVDFKSDNHDVKASQRWQHAVQMTEYFEGQAGAYVGRMVRMDEVGT